jgi:hypothetical protein
LVIWVSGGSDPIESVDDQLEALTQARANRAKLATVNSRLTRLSDRQGK